MGKKGKKKKSKEEKWVDEMKSQEQKIYDDDHKFSKKEMKIAKRFMEKKKVPKEEAVSLEDKEIFDTSKAKEFDPKEAFKGAKTVGMEDDGEDKVVYAPEPKKEKHVHFSDDKDYVEDIEIDQHKFKKAPKGEKLRKGDKKKEKGKKKGKLKKK